MKKSTSVLLIGMAFVIALFSALLWVETLRPVFKKDVPSILLVGIIACVCISSIVISLCIDTLKKALSETKKNLLLEQVSNIPESIQGVTEFLADFLRETDDPQQVQYFEHLAVKGLVRRYMRIEDMSVFVSKLFDDKATAYQVDTERPNLRPYLESINAQLIQQKILIKKAKSLFKEHLSFVIKHKDRERAVVILIWVKDSLLLFNPSLDFPEEMRQLDESIFQIA